MRGALTRWICATSRAVFLAGWRTPSPGTASCWSATPAGVVRAFKGKGVTTAILTGMRAARVILNQGVSNSAFQAYHAANRDITSDMPFGQAMRRLTILAARLRLMGVVLRAAENDLGLRRALFDAVSAHHPYWQVVRQGLTFNAVRASRWHF